MTLHSKVDYKCKFCETAFVPIPESPHCPKCKRKSRKVFPNFVRETLGSTLFNLSKYHSVFPPAWYTGTIGDYYYRNAFAFLSFVCEEVPVSRRKILIRAFSDEEINSLTIKFLDMVDFQDESFRRDGFKNYLSLLLQSREYAEFVAH